MEIVVPPSRDQVVKILRESDVRGRTWASLRRVLVPAVKGKQTTREKKAAGEHALREALASLEAAGEIVNFGTPKTPRYVLAEFDRRMDWACETLEAKATPGRVALYKMAALRKGHRKGVTHSIIEQAVARLVETGRLIEIRPTKAIFYLHARSVLPLIPPDLFPPSGVGEQTPFSPEGVRSAYHAMVREIGFADVPITDVCERSGSPLESLHAWLREESRAGRAVPTRGDWSLAGEPARAAALILRGEPYLQIRLL